MRGMYKRRAHASQQRNPRIAAPFGFSRSARRPAWVATADRWRGEGGGYARAINGEPPPVEAPRYHEERRLPMPSTETAPVLLKELVAQPEPGPPSPCRSTA